MCLTKTTFDIKNSKSSYSYLLLQLLLDSLWFIWVVFTHLKKNFSKFFTFIEIIFINRFVYTIPCIHIFFNILRRNNKMLLVYINNNLSINESCRDNTRFFIEASILILILSFHFRIFLSFYYLFFINSLMEIGFIREWPTQ